MKITVEKDGVEYHFDKVSDFADFAKVSRERVYYVLNHQKPNCEVCKRRKKMIKDFRIISTGEIMEGRCENEN